MAVSLEELTLMYQSTSALSCPLVLAYVRKNGWSSVDEISDSTGLSVRTVFSALRVLRELESKTSLSLLPSQLESALDDQ